MLVSTRAVLLGFSFAQNELMQRRAARRSQFDAPARPDAGEHGGLCRVAESGQHDR